MKIKYKTNKSDSEQSRKTVSLHMKISIATLFSKDFLTEEAT